jgi:hypothetical protein
MNFSAMPDAWSTVNNALQAAVCAESLFQVTRTLFGLGGLDVAGEARVPKHWRISADAGSLVFLPVCIWCCRFSARRLFVTPLRWIVDTQGDAGFCGQQCRATPLTVTRSDPRLLDAGDLLEEVWTNTPSHGKSIFNAASLVARDPSEKKSV